MHLAIILAEESTGERLGNVLKIVVGVIVGVIVWIFLRDFLEDYGGVIAGVSFLGGLGALAIGYVADAGTLTTAGWFGIAIAVGTLILGAILDF
ncbi:hypothetical protein [Skermania piniformis]|uniref:GlsB/YeaQ/YmgE family stress response membrane protein n=1 Tax=Skermania pinensis TaxID=39122 RepID=A0ABX8SAY1_9ACTN|nr:hypothetical protein [Skermania piniformis]QXQ15033.1 hypothetical protein KV203_06670 [Skermania piniformis]